jgi:hypothetical protein
LYVFYVAHQSALLTAPVIEKFSFRSSFIQLSRGQIEALRLRHADWVKSGIASVDQAGV